MGAESRENVNETLVCPLDYRYGREPMQRIFSESSRLEHLLQVEAALARAHAKVGNIPVKDSKIITQKASIKYVSLDKVKAIERETKHEIGRASCREKCRSRWSPYH